MSCNSGIYKGSEVMRKKLSAILMCLSLINIPMAASAQEEYSISAIDGIDVTVQKAQYTNGLQSEFSVRNSSGTDMEVAIEVTLEDGDRNVLASADTVRKIARGRNVPFKFNSSRAVERGAALHISVVNPPKDNEIYVAENGSDSAEGSFKKPLKTLSAAIDAAKEKEGDISIVMRGGEYEIRNTVNVAEIGSLSSLTVKSDGTDVIFTGGVSVTGADFKKVTDTGILSMFPENVKGKLYSINLSDYGIKKDTDNPRNTALYYNGETEQIAKYPNDGYSATATPVWLDYTNKILAVDAEDIKDWKNYNEAWISGFFFYDWDFSSNKIASVANGRITISPYNAGSYTDNEKTGKKWCVYNMPSELDIEGEYIIKGNVLYYYPREADVSDGTFDNTEIRINTDKTDMINISCGNVAIENITFENSRGYFINAAADKVKLLGCNFKNNAASAVYVDGNNNLVSACDFVNIGARGIYMTGGDRNTLTSSESLVTNCYFERTGQFQRTNAAALTVAGCGTVASYNTITKTPHLALSYRGNNLVIEHNDIYECLTDNSGDAGIIYTGNDLSNLGNVMRENYIHDSNSGLGAIYWDDFLSGQTAEHNVIENITSGGVFVHGGVCNTFNGNIVKGTNYGARVRGKGLYITLSDGTKVNAWDEIAGRYSPYANVFMACLEGSERDPKNYPGFPWKESIWQQSFGNVLKYVNTRTNSEAVETSVCDNTFIDIAIEGCYTFAGTTDDDITITGNAEEFTDATRAEYENIKSTSGIYADKYRKM